MAYDLITRDTHEAKIRAKMADVQIRASTLLDWYDHATTDLELLDTWLDQLDHAVGEFADAVRDGFEFTHD